MYTDICERRAHCLDGICKCPFGYGILDRGNCERLPFDPSNHIETIQKTTTTIKLTDRPTTATPSSVIHKFLPQRLDSFKPMERIKEILPHAIKGVSRFISAYSLAPSFKTLDAYGNLIHNINEFKQSIQEPVTITLPPPPPRSTTDGKIDILGTNKSVAGKIFETTIRTTFSFIQNPNRFFVSATPVPPKSVPLSIYTTNSENEKRTNSFILETITNTLPEPNYTQKPIFQSTPIRKPDYPINSAPKSDYPIDFAPKPGFQANYAQTPDYQLNFQQNLNQTNSMQNPDFQVNSVPKTDHLVNSMQNLDFQINSASQTDYRVNSMKNPDYQPNFQQKLDYPKNSIPNSAPQPNSNQMQKSNYQANSVPNPIQFKSMPGPQNYENPFPISSLVDLIAPIHPQIQNQTQNQVDRYQNAQIFQPTPIPITSTTQIWTPELQTTTTTAVNQPFSELPKPGPAQPLFVGLGQTCIPNWDICPENSLCVNTCVCLPGWSAMNGQCVKELSPPIYIPFGSSCQIKDDCEGGSECINFVCKCPMKTAWKDGKCYKDSLRRGVATPGDSCERGEVCAGGAMCDFSTKKCTCAANHDSVRGTCMRIDTPYMVLPGGSCIDENVCIGGSKCDNGVCVCDEKHYAVDGYCRPLGVMHSDVEFSAGIGLRFSSNPKGVRKRADRCPLPEEPQKCELPHCFCSKYGRSPPARLDPKDIPQFIVLTFDDAVNARTTSHYRKLFSDIKYRNPNGCPIKGTFFVSHEWTNYNDVQWLFDGGHELASNSITHSYIQGRGMTKWLNEMDGQRRIMAKFGNIPEEEIVGLRAPQLAVGGDEQFEMMLRAGFLYDNSISANPGVRDAPYWPQTLDYRLSWQCQEKDCPQSSFPGLWTIPLNQFFGVQSNQLNMHKRASMLRAVAEDNSTVNDLYHVLTMNFEKAYFKNKAPYVLSLNADFLQLVDTTVGFDALTRFLDNVMQKPDVYVVPLKSLIKWMQNPKPLKELDSLDEFKCKKNGTMHTFSTNNQNTSTSTLCSQPNKCIFSTPFLPTGEHQFQTCNPCPSMFPWIDNPMGILEY